MAVRYFINAETRRGKMGHGKAFAAASIEAGYTECTAEQFDDFRCENRELYRQMVAQ